MGDKTGSSKAGALTGYQGEANTGLQRGVDGDLIHSPHQKLLN